MFEFNKYCTKMLQEDWDVDFNKNIDEVCKTLNPNTSYSTKG